MQSEFHLPHEYPNEPRLRDMPRTVLNVPRMGLLAVIRLYQMTLSRTIAPGSCRFYPTCSHYGYQAIYKHGALKGNYGGLAAALQSVQCGRLDRYRSIKPT
jgi:putative membrane protein insertion efficiency factor